MIYEKLTDFTFDGQQVIIAKFHKFSMATRFRDECIPLVLDHFRPMELVIAALINQYAPNTDWGLMDSLISSEKIIDRAIVPAFRVMIEYYLPDRKYTFDHIDTLCTDIGVMYQIVYSQMLVEGIFAFYMRRKFTFFADLNKFININLSFADLQSKLESMIKNNSTSRDPDKEFVGVK